MAIRVSGTTNSCSGWRTVSTGHGAVRATRSATLPISQWETAPRPCVPVTMRSICSRPAYSTMARAGPFEAISFRRVGSGGFLVVDEQLVQLLASGVLDLLL